MTAGILLCMSAGLLWTLTGIILSRAVHRGGDPLAVCGLAGCLFAALAWIVLPDHSLLLAGAGTRDLVWVMGLAGICGAGGMLVLQRAMAGGHHGVVWATGQSALILPFLSGILLFGDSAGPGQWGGLALILASLICFACARQPTGSTHPARSGWFILALVALLLLGSQQALSAVPSYWTESYDHAGIRVPMMALGGGLAYLLVLRRRLLPQRAGATACRWAVLLAVNTLLSQSLLIRGLDALAGDAQTALGYPIAIGTCILAFCAYSVVLLREDLDRKRLVGMLCCLGGIILVATHG